MSPAPPADRPLSPELVQHYRDVVRIHADDPVIGACPVCLRSRCRDWRYAREALISAGEFAAGPEDADAEPR
ncbi:hypothetical protein SAMN05444365_1011153 [Micromonospora pattaloongensis]|uniref:Uncharacterized protein n=2 Tax=Micromonospora pattaloongensis TaxID=405436 RepID=A0A1H3I7A0_9ACTN|nr:hypothetical protein SAMN05444365_1011153 [Micromonospora pattaloongensis]